MPRFDTPNVRSGLPGFAPGVRDAIYQHVYTDPRNELGGMLIGDRREHAMVIVGAIPAVGSQGDVTSLTFTHEAWAHVWGEIDRRYPGAQILGWYHSHPGHGIFLSRHDRFIHRHFFGEPWQVAIVVDPQRHEEGLFAWQRGDLVRIAGARVDPRWARGTTGDLPSPPPATAPAPLVDPARRGPSMREPANAATARESAPPRSREELRARRARQAAAARRKARLTLAAWAGAAVLAMAAFFTLLR